ncbi:hypothetical protein EJ02DRAFT_406854 [Clathrospora elynae]|uniref:Uncharacterized protein n=1 Tax=Clathrospora elynae TaxID=706981 RepID=A0A6A5SHV8_9PLEO|nr:hypothetical protein EJ02DRAFT_406854 [Clathrospora elynae]
MFRPKTINESGFLGTAAAQAVCTTVLDLYVLLEYFAWINPVVYQVPRSYVVPLNVGLFMLGNIYQAALAFDALRMKNNLQLYSICVLNISLFVFSVMRYFQIKDTAAELQLGQAGDPAVSTTPFTNRSIDYWGKVQGVLLGSSAFLGVCSLTSCVLVFFLQREFRWAIYRHISGSLEMLRRYLAYQVLLVLLRIEVYFFVGFVIIYGLIDVHYVQPEFTLTMALIPALVIQIAMTIIFTKSENILGAVGAIVLRLGEMAYLVSRILVLNGNSPLAQTLLKDEMLLFTSVALALGTLACLNAMLCVFNFNKGLKPLLHLSSWKQTPHEFQRVNVRRFSERIELD